MNRDAPRKPQAPREWVIARHVALATVGVLVAAPALAVTYQWSAGEYATPDVCDATTLSYSAPSTLSVGSSLDVSATDPANSPGGNSKLFYLAGFSNDGGGTVTVNSNSALTFTNNTSFSGAG